MQEKTFRPSRWQLLPPVLSGSALKILAIVTMLIDHIGAVILENGFIHAYQMNLPQALSYENTLLLWKIDWVLRKIGRIAFPIFCFLLVEGFIHTSNRKKYALRLALFALLSEIPFDLCFRGKFLEFSYQNVMITLLVGFLAITAMDEARKRVPALALVAAAAGLLLGYLLKTDYSYRGVILIILLYLFQSYPLEKTIAGCLSLLWEPPACFAFIPINMYNGQRGRKIKYFFYFFYPVHLFLLFLIRYALLKC